MMSPGWIWRWLGRGARSARPRRPSSSRAPRLRWSKRSVLGLLVAHATDLFGVDAAYAQADEVVDGDVGEAGVLHLFDELAVDPVDAHLDEGVERHVAEAHVGDFLDEGLVDLVDAHRHQL